MTRNFFTQNAKWLLPPFLISAAAVPGLTVTFSFFTKDWLAAYGMTFTEWGLILFVSTLIAGFSLPLAGGLADRLPARPLTMALLALMALACFGMMLSRHVALLFALVFTLRFFGQGMMVHQSQTLTARWFAQNRGKAMAIALMGVVFAENLLPAGLVALRRSYDWRTLWGFLGVAMLILLVVLYWLMRDERKPEGQSETNAMTGLWGRHWRRSEALKNWVFWFATPAFLAWPLTLTMFFMLLPEIAISKGFDHDVLFAKLPYFALTAVLSTWASGFLIDKFGLPKVLGLGALTMIFGYALMSVAASLDMAIFALTLLGWSVGFNANIFGSFWAQYYGTQHVGAIRSMAAGVFICAVATGPLLAGVLADHDVRMNLILQGLSLIALTAFLLLGVVTIKTHRAF